MAGGQLRIDEMFAYIQLDPLDNTEGVIAFLSDTGWMPMVGADMKRIGSLRPLAQQVADETGRPVQLVKFSNREELEMLRPEGT
jgi:hypothetical protein